jgi:hypothetical protein
MNDWPFDDDPSVLTLTVRQIMDRQLPILLVCHDDDDGMWQFLTGGDVSMSDAVLVCLKNVVAIDSTVKNLYDLPSGWQAVRENQSAAWSRKPCKRDDE